MAEKAAFYSIHRHGFVRVAVCAPRVMTADPAGNVVETLALAREGDAAA